MNYLNQTDVTGKVVLVRADFDVPVSTDGKVLSDYRIKAILPTLDYLQKNKAKDVIIVAHMGRPVIRRGEKVEAIIAGNPTLTLEPVAQHLRKLLGIETHNLNKKNLSGIDLPAYIVNRGLYLLENVRFDWREGENHIDLAKELASLGDLFVYDAFAVGHRANSSTEAVMKLMPSVAGIQLQNEVESLSKLTQDIKHPYVMVLGGAKIETKMPIIERLIDEVDTFLIGGVMANTFLKAQGIDVKDSLVENEMIETATKLLKRIPKKLVLPTDYAWQAGKILDVGQDTRQTFKDILKDAKMIFWNGTLGLTSTTTSEFKFGSLDIADAIAANKNALTIVSGGDTIGLLEEEKRNLADYSFASTGGGATLEFLSDNELPSLKALGYYNLG